MMSLLSLLLPSVVPAATGIVTRVVDHFTGGAKPQNVAEECQLMTAQTAQMQALAALDAPGANCSVWVNDLRATARYILGFAVIGYAIAVQYTATDPNVIESAQNAMSVVFSFFFGERMYLYMKRQS